MITANKVVSMNYVLRDEAGNILDQSQGEPLTYLQGHRNIIPGLEKALDGLKVGDKKVVVVSPEEGYGVYNPNLRFAIERQQFGGETPEPGQMVRIAADNGDSALARIIGIDENAVFLDANHPLAGQALHFDVEITDIRDASNEELAHGHPHGPGGHHH